ncbi:MAG: metalloregulator ArsR/SmtB family transcription factor [Kiritimatiellales bacterium]
MENVNDFWRVCRVVSHKNRLKLLWLLFDVDELCVCQLTTRIGMTQPNASIQLRALQSAGLIRFRRKKMNVIYRAEADDRIEFAAPLLEALRMCCEKPVPLESVIRQVTAFTHERRMEIVRTLKKGSSSYNQLLEQTGMTTSALSRHLCKLEKRKVVGKTGGLYRLLKPSGKLGSILLKFACNG